MGNTLTAIGNAADDTATTARNVAVDAATAVRNAAVDTAVTVGNAAVDTAVTVRNAAVDTAVTVGNAAVDTAVTVRNVAVDTAVTVRNVAVDTAVTVGNATTQAAGEVRDAVAYTATAIGNYVSAPSVEQTPLLPGFTGTVTVQGRLSEAEKLARGAVRIDLNAPPEVSKQYDGMYIGSDGYAYAPDKFAATEVPAFTPSKPLSGPPPTTYFVNGILTDPQGVMSAAGKLAARTGTNVVPIYNATEGISADVGQTATDRLGIGTNKAAETLTRRISEDLANGHKVNVTGYSQGSAIVSRVLHEVSDQLPAKSREQQMRNINVLGIGGAGRSFPPGPQYNFYVNKHDVVPNYLGVHPRSLKSDLAIGGLIATFPALALLNGGGSGYTAPNATLHVIDDAAKGGLSPHYLETYFKHIPER